MSERCENIHDLIDSRCILRKGHSGKCWFPNFHLKTMDPVKFFRLRNDGPRPLEVIGLENLTWEGSWDFDIKD